MNSEQIRAAMGAIKAKIDGIKAGEAGYTAEQLAEIEKLGKEFDALNTQLTAALKVEEIQAASTQSTGRKTAVETPAPVRVEVGRTLNERFGGFKSSGEFLMAVRDAAQGNIHKVFASTAYERTGEDGGYLVPEEISTAIEAKLKDKDASLMASANVITVSGNSLTLPIDETTPWSGGITAYWMAEGASFTESKPVFGEASWKLNKLGALVKVTDELNEDAVALESYIMQGAPAAITAKINDAIIGGTGAGKPQGLLNAAFAYTVSKESGPQTADTVVAENIIKMYGRMLPSSLSKAVWLINPAVTDQLRLMKDDNDNYIYINPGGQLNSTPYGSLMGRPVLPMLGGMRALGDLGDIMFVDLSYYYMIKKAQGVKSATSIHLAFDQEKTAYRFSFRVDGKCPFKAPVRTQYGSYDMSGIVLLEAR